MFRDKSADRTHGDQDLCLLQVDEDAASRPSASTTRLSTCSRRSAGRPTASRSSRSAATTEPDVKFGMVRYKSKKAFSADAKDWGKGKFVTDISQAAARACSTSRSRRTASGWRRSPTSSSDAFQLYLGKPEGLPAHRRQAAGRARVQGRVALGRQGARGRPGRRALLGDANGQLARMPVDEPAQAAARSAPRRQPGLPAADAGVAVLCTSCRRQLSRGADYCGTCGTPVAGAAAPLELVLADADARAARRRHDDRARAGQHRRARRPERLARARAHLARRQRRRRADRGRGLERRHARRRRRDLRGDRAARRGEGCSSATQKLRVERRRDVAEAGRTIVVRPGASLVVPALGPPGRRRPRRRSSG